MLCAKSTEKRKNSSHRYHARMHFMRIVLCHFFQAESIPVVQRAAPLPDPTNLQVSALPAPQENVNSDGCSPFPSGVQHCGGRMDVAFLLSAPADRGKPGDEENILMNVGAGRVRADSNSGELVVGGSETERYVAHLVVAGDGEAMCSSG